MELHKFTSIRHQDGITIPILDIDNSLGKTFFIESDYKNHPEKTDIKGLWINSIGNIAGFKGNTLHELSEVYINDSDKLVHLSKYGTGLVHLPDEENYQHNDLGYFGIVTFNNFEELELFVRLSNEERLKRLEGDNMAVHIIRKKDENLNQGEENMQNNNTENNEQQNTGLKLNMEDESVANFINMISTDGKLNEDYKKAYEISDEAAAEFEQYLVA